MSTTTTYVAFKTQLVNQLATALATSGRGGEPVQVSYAWPGGITKPDSVFLGRYPDGTQGSLLIESHIPTIKTGREQRQESYTVEATIISMSPDLKPDQAGTAEQRAFTIYAALDSLLADTPKIGMTSIQWARITSTEIVAGGPNPFEFGYGVMLVVSIDVEARLT